MSPASHGRHVNVTLGRNFAATKPRGSDELPRDLDAAAAQVLELGEDGRGDVDVAGGAVPALVDDRGGGSLAVV